MKKHLQDGLSWYSFDIFENYPELKHGVFTRQGGVSGPGGEDLHLAYNQWAPTTETKTNISRAEAVLKLPPVALAGQSHTANITVVYFRDHYHPGSAAEIRPKCDALVAPEAGVSLLVTVGDCQAVIIYDPLRQMLSLVHSGWQGSVQNIIGATVSQMVDLGADPARMLVGISPSLGPCCAEFVNYRDELPESFQDFMVTENHFDFWAISRHQLSQKGVDPTRVEVARVCTRCSSQFFSHRRGEAGRFGLMAGIII